MDDCLVGVEGLPSPLPTGKMRGECSGEWGGSGKVGDGVVEQTSNSQAPPGPLLAREARCF